VATEPGQTEGFDDTTYAPTARPGHRLPHFWFAAGDSLFDHLGREFSLVGDLSIPAAKAFMVAADEIGIPLAGVDFGKGERRDLFGAALILVRPDQHVAWRGEDTDDAMAVLRLAIGEDTVCSPFTTMEEEEGR